MTHPIPRRASRWSISDIRHSTHPGFTIRVVEPKPGAALAVYWWKRGKWKDQRGRQRGAGLGGWRPETLGSTQDARRAKAEQLGRDFIKGHAFGECEYRKFDAVPVTIGALCDVYEERGRMLVSKDYKRDALSCVQHVRERIGADFMVSALTPRHVEK